MSDDIPSSPPRGGTLEEDLAYYKSQYEQLEVELQEFQASSRELEAELEKDIDASEKRERQLQEKVENYKFEVEEWKTKYKQSKVESNTAQNNLQREITSLRDTTRSLQLKLRDIEVANDDFERQARNQSSSLEDLESKYNVAIERGVLIEEEIRVGEQEREGLRIELQRARDELSDLKIEAEILQEKLRLSEAAVESAHARKTAQYLSTGTLRPRSPISETSTSVTTLSSPTSSTPPSKSGRRARSNMPSPPSPPLSETSLPGKKVPVTPMRNRKNSVANSTVTPRQPLHSSARPARHSRGPSVPLSNGRTTPSVPRRTGATARTSILPDNPLPRSESLVQIRGLIGKMQKLEARVHSARSKLPAPTHTPPRASPRGSVLGNHTSVPASVTVRSSRKRASGSTTSSLNQGAAGDASSNLPVSRLSFGGAGSLTNGSLSSRPSSRASITSNTYARPASRTSMTGSRTPLGGHYPDLLRRPRSSMSGVYSASTHGRGQSVSGANSAMDAAGEESDDVPTPLARRSITISAEISGIPTPSGIPRRLSGGVSRRTSNGDIVGDMGPPPSRKLPDLGETY